MVKDMLQPWEIANVRAKRVDLGDVLRETPKRAAFCRCCGKTIGKEEEALSFYWDFRGCGSWTAVKCYAHLNCEPAPDRVREEANASASTARLAKRADRLIEKSFSAGPRKAYRLRKEAARIRQRLFRQDHIEG